MLSKLGKLAVGLAALLLSHAALALNPAIRLEDLNHASWSEKDGVPSDIQCMAQTRDGWLWLGTTDGLYRFDGVSFERYPLKRNRIFSLHAQDNGDLLISYELEGLQVLHADGKITDLVSSGSAKPGPAASMATDRAGVLWVVTYSGVHRYVNGTWQNMIGGIDWADRALSIMIDQYDRVWAANKRGVYLHDRRQDKMVQVGGSELHGSLIQSPDGRIWASSGATLTQVPAPPPGAQLPRQPDFNSSESRSYGQFDRDGNLWALRCPQGLCRLPHAGDLAAGPIDVVRQASDRLDQPWQLSALTTNSLLEDREGNIWIATKNGLDRFRENKLLPARIPGPNDSFSTATDTEGRLWAAEWISRAVWQIPVGAAPLRDPQRTASVLANDRDGALLLAGPRDIERIYRGKSSRIPLPMPGGKPVDLTVVGMLDDGKFLWMASMQTGLMAWANGVWLPRSHFKLPPRIAMSAPGGLGQLWLSHNDGGLSFYDNDQLTRYDISMVGQESGIFPGPQLVVGGERGIAVLRDRQFIKLGPANAAALRNVTGMTVMPNGDRWLNGAQGVVHIHSADWEASLRQPQLPLVYTVIDALEGYPGRAAMDNRLATLYNAGNGQLWFRATGGLVRLDTSQLRPNPIKPAVQLLRVNVDERSYPAGASVQLPAGARNFNIQYTAPGLRKPEGMRFQYFLEGVDQHWQDSGSRRAAYYTNIGPGLYTFSVRAVNEDNLASDTVASLQLQIAPTVVQSWWFQLLCVVLALLLLYGAYQYRLKIATAAIASRLQVRIEERERIARTLHDTFLQSVQALVLRVYSVLARLPEDSEPRARLEAILDDADRAMNEGRDQVHQLRTGLVLEQQLNLAGAGLAAQYPQTAFQLNVEGADRPLSPPVQEELASIAQEALRNAFQHASANLVSVRIEYHDEALQLIVADNGRGLDQEEVRSRIRERHFGMIGMRERAKYIGAAIDITSAPGQGTVISLKVAARLCYANDE
jgi:signal transduction histidine kinase/ligand-binding sensor domain-containing protein